MFFSRLFGFVWLLWAAGPILAAEYSPERGLLGLSFGFGGLLNADKVPLFAAELSFRLRFSWIAPDVDRLTGDRWRELFGRGCAV